MLLSHAWRFLILSFAFYFPALAQIRLEQLGVSYNAAFQKQTGKIVLGSIVEIQGLASWTDQQVAELAFQAAEAAEKAFNKDARTIRSDYINKHRREMKVADLWPGVTTTLVVDNTAYISTSIKGPGGYLYEPASFVPRGVKKPRWVKLRNNNNPCRTEVVEALARCQLRSTERFKQTEGDVDSSGHRTGASCGEPMAALAFCTTGSEKELADSGARVMAVKKDRGLPGEYAPPCGGWEKKPHQKAYTSEWGCKVLMNSEDGLNIRVIDKDAAEAREKMTKAIATTAIAIRYP